MKWILFIALIFLESRGAALSEGVVVEFDQEEETEEEYSGVERIFKNPVLASGLAHGTVNINKSIDSLMEGLFYSLLDNELVYDVTDASQFKLGLKRDVHSTKDGDYVVVDRFSIGPNYSTPISSVYGLPIYLGADGAVNVLDIYLRSDGKRLAEGEELSTWRMLANNWFGILPLLTAILPPSFNPNELYDPVGQLETPFLFPTSIDAAQSMPIGNIRSYSVSGSIHLGLDFLHKVSESGSGNLLKNGFDFSLPYRVFKQGEHKISVLRRGEDTFWVGLSSVDRLGHELSGNLNRVYFIFNKVASFWGGLPATILPIDFSMSDADVFKFDMIFEFDFSNKGASEAFELAVRGDFSKAESLALDADRTGVRFHFRRYSSGSEDARATTRNLFVHRGIVDRYSSLFEVTTQDARGEFHVLEARSVLENEDWDVLVGSERVTYENRATVRVVKEGTGYRFDSSAHSPVSLVLGLNIEDRFVDAFELKKYLKLIREFTDLPLKTIPDIPIRDPAKELRHKIAMHHGDPLKDVVQVSVTPTHLGRLGADAAIYISSEAITALESQPKKAIGAAFMKAFGLSGNFVEDLVESGPMASFGGSAVYYLLSPLKLVNVSSSYGDSIREIHKAVGTFREMKKARDPMEKALALKRLTDTEYPLILADALQYLSPVELPRSVTFSTKSKGRAPEFVKKQFRGMNKKQFKSLAKLPSSARHDEIREMLSRFNPRDVRETRAKPRIYSVRVFLEKMYSVANPSIAVEIVGPVTKHGSLKLFLRIEQAGKVNVGRFVLFEDVLTLKGGGLASDQSRSRFLFYISGEDRVGDGFILDQALALGGDFGLVLSISPDGELWSTEKQVQFSYQDGRLLPVEKD